MELVSEYLNFCILQVETSLGECEEVLYNPDSLHKLKRRAVAGTVQVWDNHPFREVHNRSGSYVMFLQETDNVGMIMVNYEGYIAKGDR